MVGEYFYTINSPKKCIESQCIKGQLKAVNVKKILKCLGVVIIQYTNIGNEVSTLRLCSQ